MDVFSAGEIFFGSSMMFGINMMHKPMNLFLLMVILLSLALCSCTGEDSAGSPDGDTESDIEGETQESAESDADVVIDGDIDSVEAEAEAEEEQGPALPFKVAVISDTHILPDIESMQDRNFIAFADYVKNMEAGPALIFNTGDNVEDMLCIPDVTCEDPPKILMTYRSLIEDNYDIPYHFVLGNHDNRYLDMYGGNDIPLAMWQKAFEGSELYPGPRYYFDYSGFRFVILFGSEAAVDHDTNDMACFGDEQLAWLDEVLTDAPPALLFWHQMINPLAESESETPNPILQVIEAHKDTVKAAFAGHGHAFARIEWQGVMFYETTTLGRDETGSLPHHMLECDPTTGEVSILNADEIVYSEGI